ncbi:hypothetical protein SteCoe_25172 [Stentor coeruleus]|uniref:Condensin complex subunit 1 C-terminal domain-containing protein n=1 Tax=Stentor coeruleus TaxID=5963 RepID=A0A1R2BFT6_9CILI|nr:hypothetical protein SteCoe_25172 [Stentor coeruleus]
MFIEIVFNEIEKGNDNDIILEIMEWIQNISNEEIWEGWLIKAINLLLSETDKSVKFIVNIVKNNPNLLNEILILLSENILSDNQINETQGIKNVGVFIVTLSCKIPKEMLMNISLIVNLLNCKVYALRNSVIISIGEILYYIIKKDLDQNAEKDTYMNYREQLLLILKSRIMDKSSYCRTKVLEIFENLARDNFLPRDWFVPVLKISSSRLEDCSPHVRKKALILLKNLIYKNKLLNAGNIKIEPKVSIESLLQKHHNILISLNNANYGKFDDNTLGIDKEEIQHTIFKEQVLIKFLEEYLEMIQIFDKSLNIVYELIKSKNSKDIIGSINVLVGFCTRGICESKDAVSAMVNLLANCDENIKLKIKDAFFDIYLNKDFISEDIGINNMLNMIETLNLNQTDSLGVVFSELFSTQKILDNFKNIIWTKYKNEISYPCTCILKYLSMSLGKDFLITRYHTLISRILSLYNDWKVYRECLIIIQNLGYQGEKTDNFLLKSAFLVFDIENSGWFPVIEQFIRTCFILCQPPLIMFKFLAIKALKSLLNGNCSEIDIAKTIFVGSEVLIKVFFYGDKVIKELKKNIEDDKSRDEMDEINGRKEAKVQMEIGNLKMMQENLVFEGVLGKFTPIVLALVLRLDDIKTQELKKAVLISLGKIMYVNQKICEQHLELLLKIAQNNRCPYLRTISIISLSDLIMKYPNLLEQHSSCFFPLLSDPCIEVRKKSLILISHLVLNDIIKIKGLMANILLCSLDQNLKAFVIVFIQELNQKTPNSIYNIIPDSINNLLKMNLPHEDFKTIADIMFLYITKERQIENLTEKMSAKFKDGNKEDWLNIGYCLTRLNLNERALRKLLDGVLWWKNKVVDDNMLKGYFIEIASKCRKNLKSDWKVVIDEFEAVIKEEVEITRKRKIRKN